MKFMKVLLAALLTFVLVVPSATAQEVTPNCQCSSTGGTTLDQVRDELEASGVEIVDFLTKDGISIVNQVIDDQIAAHSTTLTLYGFSNYSLISGADMYKGFKNVELDGVTYDYVAVNY
jgi:hypothetical protein